MNNLISPYFAITTFENEISPLRKKIMSIDLLHNKEITLIPDSHITVNYSSGCIDKTLVQESIYELCQRPLQIQVTGASTIISKYYNKTILALTLNTSEDYLFTKEFLKSKLNSPRFTLRNQKATKKFDAHISLGLIPNLTNKEHHQFNQALQQLNLSGPILNGSSLVIYNPYREKVLEQEFTQIKGKPCYIQTQIENLLQAINTILVQN